MSFLAARPLLAAALSEVPGVKGYAYRPRAARVGDAWPKWMGAVTHDAPGAFTQAWQIIILLPADDAGQEDWISARMDALIDALSPVVWVEQVTPGLSDDAPALMLTCRE